MSEKGKTKEKKLILIYGYIRENIKHYFINNIVDVIKEYFIQKFGFDAKTLLYGLKLSNDNCIVTHNGRDRVNYLVLTDTVFNTGKHYFEIKLIKINNNYDICIGLVPNGYKPIHQSIRPGYRGVGWGYALSANRFHKDGYIDQESYGIQGNQNDIIKCEFDFDNKTIEFYVNSISQGIAFKNLYGNVRPAISVFGIDNCVQLLVIE